MLGHRSFSSAAMPSKQQSGANGAQGTDGQYRMIIEQRYRERATARKGLHQWAKIALAATLVKGAWQLFPAALGDEVPLIICSVTANGVLAFMLYRIGFGLGKPQVERRWALILYAVVTLAACFQVMMAARAAHEPDGFDRLHHLKHAGRFISRLLTGHSQDGTTFALLRMVDALLDLVSIGLLLQATKAAFQYLWVSRPFISQTKKAQ